MKRRKYFGLTAAVLLALSGCTTVTGVNEPIGNVRVRTVERSVNYHPHQSGYVEPKPITHIHNINDYGKEIKDASKEFHVSESLILRIIHVESSGNHNSYSNKGAIGFMGLMPITAKEMGVNPRDPVQNIYGGTKYLRRQIEKYGDLKMALAAYNWGPANVDSVVKADGENWLGSRSIPNETRGYLRKILGVNSVAYTNPTVNASSDSTSYAAANDSSSTTSN